uniref:Phosphatidylinositol 4phosphate 5kinase (PIPKD12/GPCRPIPK) putative n=1 Tax=Albugo laibachii Nc14 TaxID=890382 RepID=F0WST3_9STRA|nr:Phosphatidylinositol 4phosphate 5kinase (PIPKD12/GPCRPIPK) putative [Albugo laibachii Nc14]|eukprot:CCA24411.1 Phosphatidylinositol 4phosphate 5kinase (PIPKD12/GPCRPIPK) putative [Albugo laibachii Nc14]
MNISNAEASEFVPILHRSSFIYFIAGVIGFVFYAFIICTYTRIPSISAQHPAANIIIWHTGCGLMLMASFISYFLTENVIDAVPILTPLRDSLCQYFGPWNQFFLLGSTLWYLMLAVDLLLALFNPWIGYSCKAWTYHIIAWGISTLTAAWMVVTKNVGLSTCNMCWIRKTSTPEQVNLAHWMFLFGPVILTWLFLFFVLIFATIRFAQRQLDVTYRAKRRSLLQYYRYLLLYGAHWAACGSIYYEDYHDWFGHYRNQRRLLITLVIVFASYPILLSIVWVVNTDLIQHCTKDNTLPKADKGREAFANTDHFSAALRKDLMRYTTTGIRCSLRGDSVDTVSRSSRLLEHDLESRPLISPLASTSPDLYHEKKRVAATIYNVEYRFYEKLGFTDYAPRIFQSIRELSGIRHDLYEQSFADTLLERASEGKSGMLFYFTTDRKYLVKTMTKMEHKFLLKILPVYHQYIMKQPKSLLCRFLGCHSMQLPVGWNTMFFVVMENVMAGGKVHERYDLKGIVSAAFKNKDYVRQHPSIEARSQLSPALSIEFSQILSRTSSDVQLGRDQELLSRHVALNVNASIRANFSRQIISDCGFLQRLGIMDYSCLLGIRHYSKPLRETEMNDLPRNALISVDYRSVYYVGFIDILQYYNSGWKCQRAILSLLIDPTEITALPPAEYALRFLQFIHDHLLNDVYASTPQQSYGSFANCEHE